MDVNEVLLPGVGLLYEFVNLEGDRIGVVARRSGDFELAVYGEGDPDQARAVFRLTGEEADVVAEILGAPRIAERFADLTREVPGLSAGQVEVLPGTPFVGRPLENPGHGHGPARRSWRSSAVRRSSPSPGRRRS
ncbi:hypothetical protein SBADM41S_10534 [Streptomyces badius]